MQAITLNHKIVLLDPADFDGQPLSPYERDVLQFCRQWLSGQQTFSLTTSGSTGQPKRIILHREQMKNSARLTGEILGLQAGDKALVCLSVNYIAGMMMLVRGFELGLDLSVVTPAGNPLRGFSTGTHFDFSAFVPLQLQQILAASHHQHSILNGMKAILIGGAPVNMGLKEQLQAVTAPIYHTYGMTETATHIALKRLNGAEASEYFIPLPGVEISLDQRGCMTIKAAVTKGQTLYTNDLAELNPDGSFKWLGRIDNVINSGGVKVRVEKVEAALENLLCTWQQGRLAGRRFIICPLPHPRLGQTVVAVIEGHPFSAAEQAQIQSKLRETLTRYEVPRAFYFLPALPETPTGKIDRMACLKDLE